MKKVRILPLLLAIILLLTACGLGNSSDQDMLSGQDSGENSDGKVDAVQPEDSTPTMELVKMTSTGEIPYESFEFNEFRVNSYYNSYYDGDGDVGNYIAVQEDWYADVDTSLFPYEYNGKCGYADANGNIVISEKYGSASVFFEEKAFVSEDFSQWKIIDKKGNVLLEIPEEYTKESYLDDSRFVSGKAVFAEPIEYIEGFNNFNGVWLTIIDEDMNIRRQRIDFVDFVDFSAELAEGYRVINTKDFKGVLVELSETGSDKKDIIRYHLYDIQGKLVWQTATEETHIVRSQLPYGVTIPLAAFVTKNGYMNIVGENGKWGLLNLKTGDVQIPCEYDFVGAYADGLVQVCRYGKWGYLDINGTEVIKPSYKSATAFMDGYAVVVNEEEKYALLDKKGSIVTTYDFGVASTQRAIGPIIGDLGIVWFDNWGKQLCDFRGEKIGVRDGSLQDAYISLIFVSDTYVVDDNGNLYQLMEKE